MKNSKNQSRYKKILLILILAVLLLTGFLVTRFIFDLKSLYNFEYIQFKPIDKTANWQVYRNEQYGFEIKYPEGWSFVEYPAIDSVGFGDPPPPEGTGEVSPAVSVSMFFEPLDITMNRFKDARTDTPQENIIIDGMSAVRIEGYFNIDGPIQTGNGFKYVRVFFQKNGLAYMIRFTEQHKDDLENYKIFDNMLLTFRSI